MNTASKWLMGMTASLAMTSGVFAAEDGPYMTFGGGAMSFRGAAVGSAAADLNSTGTYNVPTLKRSNQTGYQIGLGTMIDEYVGAEAAYNWSNRKTSSNLLTTGQHITLKSSGASGSLSGVGKMPLGNGASAYLKAGVAYSEIRRNFSSTGLAIHPDINKHLRAWGPQGAVGLQYDFNKVVGMRVEAAGVAGKASNYNVRGDLVLRFGGY